MNCSRQCMFNEFYDAHMCVNAWKQCLLWQIYYVGAHMRLVLQALEEKVTAK